LHPPTAGVDGCFYAHNDSFVVADNMADGKPAVLKWFAHDGSGRKGNCVDRNGSLNGWKRCDFNFREGKRNYLVFGVGHSNITIAWISGR
jgi:hypothetical protein